MYRILTFLVSLTLLLQICAWPARALSKAQVAKLDSAMARFMARWNIPGGALAVAKGGRLVYSRGFGWADQERLQPAQARSLFRIASVSKPITAVTILKLVQEGRLGLDDKVFGPEGILNDPKYLGFRDPRLAHITVRQLMGHTAGWDRNLKSFDVQFELLEVARALGVDPPPSHHDIIQYMLGQELDFEPGSKMVYSNFGYNVLGRIIDKITGYDSYEAYVREKLLLPLGISTMAMGQDINQLPGEVRYYDIAGRRVDSIYGDSSQTPKPYGGISMAAMDAHGGWVATAPDLLRFLGAMEGQGNTPAMLSPELRKAMLSPPPGLSERSYGLGWELDIDGGYGHDGLLPGSAAVLKKRASGVSWAALFNHLPEMPGDASLTARFSEEMNALLDQVFDPKKLE